MPLRASSRESATVLSFPTPWPTRAAGVDARPARRPALSAGTSRRSSAVVVGDLEFCTRVRAVTGDRVRIVGHWMIDDLSRLSRVDLYDELRRCDRAIIDGRNLSEVRRDAPELLDSDVRLLVAPGGRVDPELLREPLSPSVRLLKRSLDVILSVAALLLTLPVLLMAVIAIRLDSPGPVLFSQTRLGAGGRKFRLYKLRTMSVGAEDPEVLLYAAAMIRCQALPQNGMFKLGSNRRITRVGRILRRFSIDELAQLWNVLKGDMSLVGPRPPIIEEAACYSDLAWQRLRLKPGITGLAQVNGRSSLRFDEIVTLDLQYGSSWSLLLELKILLRTPLAVFSARGAT